MASWIAPSSAERRDEIGEVERLDPESRVPGVELPEVEHVVDDAGDARRDRLGLVDRRRGCGADDGVNGGERGGDDPGEGLASSAGLLV